MTLTEKQANFTNEQETIQMMNNSIIVHFRGVFADSAVLQCTSRLRLVKETSIIISCYYVYESLEVNERRRTSLVFRRVWYFNAKALGWCSGLH